MLVLSRKKNEVIRIGDDIEVVIVDIRGDKCRVGITAPKQVPVHRAETFEDMQAKGGVKSLAKDQDVKLASDQDTQCEGI